MTDVAEIAGSLTKAQREAITEHRPCRSWWGDAPAIMRPRHMATERRLRQLGLIALRGSSSAVATTPLGEQVRAHLLSEKKQWP